MIRRFTAADGLALAYRDEGEGLPILCLPGLTRNHRDFDDLARALGGRHRLVRMDFRGRGASDWDPDPMRYTAAVEAGDVLALLDHLELDRVVVVGTSRGGIVAMLLAAMARDRLAGVLLNDIGPDIAPEGLARILTYLGVTPRAATYEAGAAALEATLGPQFPGVPRARWLACARRWFDAGPEGLRLNYDPALRRAFEAAATGGPVDLWPFFDALAGLPLAVLRGEHSDILAPATFAAMRDRRPDAIFVEVRDRGHVPFLDEPEALAALDALLARIGPRPQG